jgi:hypothetical protein
VHPQRGGGQRLQAAALLRKQLRRVRVRHRPKVHGALRRVACAGVGVASESHSTGKRSARLSRASSTARCGTPAAARRRSTPAAATPTSTAVAAAGPRDPRVPSAASPQLPPASPAAGAAPQPADGGPPQTPLSACPHLHRQPKVPRQPASILCDAHAQLEHGGVRQQLRQPGRQLPAPQHPHQRAGAAAAQLQQRDPACAPGAAAAVSAAAVDERRRVGGGGHSHLLLLPETSGSHSASTPSTSARSSSCSPGSEGGLLLAPSSRCTWIALSWSSAAPVAFSAALWSCWRPPCCGLIGGARESARRVA